jgi:DNA-binding CsgD family transcriptional regulator
MSELRIRVILGLVAFGAFASIMALEIITENDEIDFADIAVDALVLLLTIASVAAAVGLFNRIEQQVTETREIVAALDKARLDGAQWRAAVEDHVEGLKSAIDRQFDDWTMSPAERDIALLILKGFSHKEIANLRTTSERTIRQQAQSVYRKSGLPGKYALSAFFLEDLLGAEGDRSRPRAQAGNGHARPKQPATH